MALNYAGVLESLNFNELSSDELEDIGRRLCGVILSSVGMVKYSANANITYDLTIDDIGDLMSYSSSLVRGISVRFEREQYIDCLNKLIGRVITYAKDADTPNSVKYNMYALIYNELVRIQRGQQHSVFKLGLG